MGNISKRFASILIVILVVPSLIMLESASAQSATSRPVIIATPTPAPYVSPAPTPTPTINIALSYREVSNETADNNTRIVLAVNVQYNFGDPVTLDFTDFVLELFMPHGFPDMMAWVNSDNVRPSESGTVTVSSNDREANFQLTFEFPTMQMDVRGLAPFDQLGSYDLKYTGNIAVFSSPTPISSPSKSTPTVTLSPTPLSANFTLDQWSSVAIGIAAAAVAVCMGLIIYSRKRKG